MTGTWIETSFEVGNQRVEVSVERLEDSLRERAAALLAWTTLETLLNAETGGEAWHNLVNELLSQHVSFTIPEIALEQLGASWWQETLGRALATFVRCNELAPRINHHLHTFNGTGCPGRQAS